VWWSDIAREQSGELRVEPPVRMQVARVVDHLVVREAEVRRVVEDGNTGGRELGPHQLEKMVRLGIAARPGGMEHDVKLAVKLRAILPSSLLEDPWRQLRVSINESQRKVDVEHAQEPRVCLQPGERAVEPCRVRPPRVERAVTNERVVAVDGVVGGRIDPERASIADRSADVNGKENIQRYAAVRDDLGRERATLQSR